jgi:hypothetical protein
MRDMWLLSDRAFAIAESPTLGVKILEWTDAAAAWSYIDDNSQNEVGGQYAGTIWAPNDDEVYFAVAPAYIFHGTRNVAPATGWTWSSQRLPDNNTPPDPGQTPNDHGRPFYYPVYDNYTALGVWGTSGTDVYAWYANTVFHWKAADGGAPAWVPEYVADDAESTFETLSFVSAGGSGPDDVWFSGGRGTFFTNCPLLVHKTPSGFVRVADGIVDDADSLCAERAGFQLVDGAMGWVTDLQSTGVGQLIALKGAHDLVTISGPGDSPTITASPIPPFVSIGSPSPSAMNSLWKISDDVWLTGWGLVVHGPSDGDAGAFKVSTLSLNGAPLGAAMYRVRGNSSGNLWAIGNGYAFHKTTP